MYRKNLTTANRFVIPQTVQSLNCAIFHPRKICLIHPTSLNLIDLRNYVVSDRYIKIQCNKLVKQ